MGSILDQCANIEKVDLRIANDDGKLRVYKCTLNALRKFPDTIVYLFSIGVNTLKAMDAELSEILQGLDNICENSLNTKQIEALEQAEDEIRKARGVLSTAITLRDRDDYDAAEVSDAFSERVRIMQNHLRNAIKKL